MRLVLLLPLAVIATALPSQVLAQRGGSTVTRGAPPAAPSPSFTLPSTNAVKDLSNPAELLVDKRKKLDLDAAAIDSLKSLSTAINERNAPLLASYDSLRIKMRAESINPSGGGAASAGSGGARGGNPLMRGMTEVTQRLQAGRNADADAALVFVPDATKEEAKKLIAEQEEEFKKKMTPRSGGAGSGRPPRP